MIDYYSDNHKKDAFVQADVMGPSISYRLNYKNNVGLYTRARAVASGRNLDPGFNYYNFHEINFGNLYNLKKSDIQGAAWMEIGANFAHVLRENKEMQWSAGANLRYLVGTDAAYAKNLRDVSVSSKQDTLSLSGADIEIGLVTGAEMYDENTAGEYKLQRKGGGIGLDIGTSLLKKRFTNDILIDTDVTYKWKLNFSVLDLGYIRYKDAEVHRYTIDTPIIVDFNSANNQPTVEKYFQDLSAQVYAGDSLKSKIDNRFVIGLPTALNLNFDYGITAHWYIKANVIQRVPVFENAIKRSNVINLNGRFQKEWIGISGGITSYEYKDLYLGGSLRIGPLIIGSDNFIPVIVRQKEATQADLYIGLKINKFWQNFLMGRSCNCK